MSLGSAPASASCETASDRYDAGTTTLPALTSAGIPASWSAVSVDCCVAASPVGKRSTISVRPEYWATRKSDMAAMTAIDPMSSFWLPFILPRYSRAPTITRLIGSIGSASVPRIPTHSTPAQRTRPTGRRTARPQVGIGGSHA